MSYDWLAIFSSKLEGDPPCVISYLFNYCNSLFCICVYFYFFFSFLVFPEEILQSYKAHWWSPDGLRLAYMTINDTLVPKMEVPFFTGTPYPNTLEYHYPKVTHDTNMPMLSFDSETNRTLSFCCRTWNPNGHIVYLLSFGLLQAGEENPVVHLSVVSLNGPLHTVVMKKPDDPRIGWEPVWRCQ